MVEPLEDDLEWQPLAPEAKTFWIVGATLVVAVAFGVPTAVLVASGTEVAALVTVVVAVLVWVSVRRVVARRWRSWGYAERESDLLIRRGVLIRRFTVVPYGRMQFVDVTQGPLDRWLGLSTVTLHTAAARSDATIPLLRTEEANRLRDRLVVLGDVRAAGL